MSGTRTADSNVNEKKLHLSRKTNYLEDSLQITPKVEMQGAYYLHVVAKAVHVKQLRL